MVKCGRFLRSDKIGFCIFLAVLFLATASAAYLGIGAGANVNCIYNPTTEKIVCNSTNGNTDSTSPYASMGTPPNDGPVFTEDNDTASIEAGGAIFRLILGALNSEELRLLDQFKGGSGNDTFYIRDPRSGTAFPIAVYGEDGDDVILDGSTAWSTLNGNAGNDFIAEDAAGTLFGSAGNDLLAGGRDTDCLEGGEGNDVLIGGPGLDDYKCYFEVIPIRDGGDPGDATTNAGDDILIIHRGDVNSNEQYTCYGGDTILLFGFNLDLVLELTDATSDQIFSFAANPAECDPTTTGDACFADPVNNSTGQAGGARYHFQAASGHKCTIISVD